MYTGQKVAVILVYSTDDLNTVALLVSLRSNTGIIQGELLKSYGNINIKDN